MQAAVYIPEQGIETQEMPIPKIGADEILLKVKACGICGTDVLKVNRSLPKKNTVLGHELAGVVEEVGSEVSDWKKGDRLVVAHHVPCGTCHYCRHGNHSMCRHFKKTNLDPGGFAEYLRIPAEHVQNTAFRIEEDFSDEEALFTEPLSCCVRNIRRAKLLENDFVVVVGMGSIGLMTLQLLKNIPTQVLALDLKPERLELAQKLGADFVLDGRDKNITQRIQELTDNRGADLVVFTAGGAPVFQQAFDWVREGGALNLFASLSGERVPTSIDQLYHREITVFSSYSPSPEDLKTANQLLLEKKVLVKDLITHHLGLGEINQGIELMNQQQALKVIVHPHQA